MERLKVVSLKPVIASAAKHEGVRLPDTNRCVEQFVALLMLFNSVWLDASNLLMRSVA